MLVKLTPGASSSGWTQTLDLGIATIIGHCFVAKLNFHSVWYFCPKMSDFQFHIFLQNLALMRLCHPPDGSISPKYKLLYFITTKSFLQREECPSF
jgi:hypothetical protein